MKNRLPGLLLLTVAVAGFLAGCGGDDSARSTASPGAGTPGAGGTPGADATAKPSATATPERPLATPTPLRDDDPLANIVAGGSATSPTAAQFRAWPQSTITANGQQYTGVSLASLASAVGAAGGFVEIEGIRSDGIRYAISRLALAEQGSTSILVLTPAGQLDLVSSSVPPEQWIRAITAISFV